MTTKFSTCVKILVLASLSFAYAAQIAPSPGADPTCDYANPPADLDCSSPVSGDYYGEGVRIGIYLTWLASWVANSYVEEEIAGALDANTIFLMAVLISMLVGTAHAQLAYIDGLILMQLCAGYLFGCLSLWGYRTVRYHKEGPVAVRHFGGFGTHARLLLMFGIAMYGSWFWIKGIKDGLIIVTDDNGVDRPCQCYPLHTFFFNKMLVLGGVRYLYILMSTGTALYFGLMLIAAVVEFVGNFVPTFSGHKFWARGRFQTGFSKTELVWIFRTIRFGNLIWMIFSIITVELTLTWNKVVSVTDGTTIATPAQLLPLLVGLTALIRVMWLAIKESIVGKFQEHEHGTVEESTFTGTLHRSTSRRYVVAWLPWISQFMLAPHSRDQVEDDPVQVAVVMPVKT